MSIASDIALTSAIASAMLFPACLFVILSRWIRRRWARLAIAILATPGAAFALTGVVAWLTAYYRVVIEGDTSIPNREGVTTSQYVNGTFFICGVYGVMFAGLGLGLSFVVWIINAFCKQVIRNRESLTVQLSNFLNRLPWF